MALGYRRISDEEDKMRNLFEKGEYPFSVKSIEEKYCKNKINKMLVVELSVMNNQGRALTITDWVMLDMENWEWKLRHFAATCDLLDQYDSDLLEARDFLAKNGIVKLIVGEYEKDGEVLKTNRVADYVKPGHSKIQSPSVNDEKPFLDDTIPF